MKPVVLSAELRQEMESLGGSRTLPHGHVRRARIVLMAADGLSNGAIAQKVGLSPQSVSKWRNRFLQQGLMGLYDERRPGRPRTIKDEKITALIRKTLKTQPKDGSTHWTCRSIAAETKVSKSQDQRIWSTLGIQPHRQKSFKLSNDAFFCEKVCDIVGLYLNPPDKGMVLAVDEKSQAQALERSQPLLPVGLGYVEGVTHSYTRHGTTTLFAALDIATGKILQQCKRRHRHQEFLQFLNHIDKNVPKDLDIHLVLDNYCTHKQTKVKRWLAARPR